MFIGHFGVGFSCKAAAPRASLGTYFLAAQFIDMLWPTFLLLGIEHARIQPGITTVTPLDFTYYPFSHSLAAVVVWGVLVGLVYQLIRHYPRGAVLVGLAVISHWVLDLIVHRPDLPLYPGGGVKVGLGLWSSLGWTLFVEFALLGAGVWLYARATRARDRIGRFGLWALVAFLVGGLPGQRLRRSAAEHRRGRVGRPERVAHPDLGLLGGSTQNRNRPGFREDIMKPCDSRTFSSGLVRLPGGLVIAIATACLALSAGHAQTPAETLLGTQVLGALDEELSGTRMLDHVNTLAGIHRVPASPGYHEAAEYLVARAKAYGLSDVHVEEFPGDGRTWFGTLNGNRGWRVEGGELREISPSPRLIGSFDDLNMPIADNSESADVTAELVDVGAGASPKDYEGKDVRGKLVLCDATPGRLPSAGGRGARRRRPGQLQLEPAERLVARRPRSRAMGAPRRARAAPTRLR